MSTSPTPSAAAAAKPRVFISYSRADAGFPVAAQFRVLHRSGGLRGERRPAGRGAVDRHRLDPRPYRIRRAGAALGDGGTAGLARAAVAPAPAGRGGTLDRGTAGGCAA